MDRRVRRTKSLIRNAFLDLLAEKNTASITITELTDRADIDRRTFYLHYSCIDDILQEIEKETTDAMHQLLLSLNEFNISSFFEGLSGIMTDNIRFWRAISNNDNYHRLWAKSKEHLKAAFHDIFYETSGLSLEDFDIYSEYVASGIISIYYNWLISSSSMPLTELTKKAEIAVANGWAQITNTHSATPS